MNNIKEPIISSDQIISAAGRLSLSGKTKMVAVAAAQDVDVIGALASAKGDGILDATLFGDKGLIEKMALEGIIDITGLDIINETDIKKATMGAVKMAAEGKADVIMKGFVSTSALLKTILSKEFGLRTKNTLSHVAVLDIPGYHKLLAMTDGGMVVKPDMEQKLQILENAMLVCRALRLNPVKVAISGTVDGDYEWDKTSIECRKLIPLIKNMGMNDMEVQGPLTLDAATSKEIATIKNLSGPVVGDADIYLMHTIEECNIVAKALINFADAVFAGVIVGARIPVSLVSRTDTIKNKKASVSLACLIAEYYKTSGMGDVQ
jgi:phosphate butyryltransferase